MNNLFNWAALSTIGLTIWGWASGWLSRLRSLIVINVKLDQEASEAFLYLLHTQFKRSKFGDKYYRGQIEHVIPAGRVLKIGYEMPSQQKQIFWRGKRFLMVGALSYNNNSIRPEFNIIEITYLRWMFDFDKLLIEAFKLINNQVDKKTKRRFFTKKIFGRDTNLILTTERNHEMPKAANENFDLKHFRILEWKYEDLGATNPENPFKPYVFPDKIEKLIEELEIWEKSRDWYLERQISHRFGILLNGKPGSGKSSLARALAQYFDYPIYIYDLATLNNKQMNEAWEEMLSDAPCVALFEDFHTLFNGRENITKKKDGVNFNACLNLISGVVPSDDVITIITTNDISKIDPALGIPDKNGKSTRVGRMDRIITLDKMDKQCREKLARKMLGEYKVDIQALVKESEGWVASQVQEHMAQIALEEYWKEKNL